MSNEFYVLLIGCGSCYAPEGSHVYDYCRENLKSHVIVSRSFVSFFICGIAHVLKTDHTFASVMARD
jgi:hypothetical protein